MPKTTLRRQKASEMRSWVPWDVKVGSLEDHMAPWESKRRILGSILEPKSDPKSVKSHILKHKSIRGVVFYDFLYVLEHLECLELFILYCFFSNDREGRCFVFRVDFGIENH